PARPRRPAPAGGRPRRAAPSAAARRSTPPTRHPAAGRAVTAWTGSPSADDLADRRPGADARPDPGRESLDRARAVRDQRLLHLHRLQDDDEVTLGHLGALD